MRIFIDSVEIHSSDLPLRISLDLDWDVIIRVLFVVCQYYDQNPKKLAMKNKLTLLRKYRS